MNGSLKLYYLGIKLDYLEDKQPGKANYQIYNIFLQIVTV